MLAHLLLLLLLLLAAGPQRASGSTCPSLLNTRNAICNDTTQCSPTSGTCVRGVCLCSSSARVGETCATPERFLRLGNVVISQPGLDFAPVRYAKPINDAFETAKANGALNVPVYDGACTQVDSVASYKVTIQAIPLSLYTKAELVPSSIKFEITSTGLLATALASFQIRKAKLDLYGGAGCCPCNGANCKKQYCVQVCNAQDAGDWIDFDFSATIRAWVDITHSNTAQVVGLVPVVRDLTLTFNDDSLGAKLNCPAASSETIANMVIASFDSVKNQIVPTLAPALRDELAREAERVASRYQGLQSYSPAPGIYLDYRVMNLTILEGVFISVEVEGKLIYEHFSNATSQRSCYINSTYADVSADHQVVPSRDWFPVVKPLSPSKLFSPMLAALRMTRSFLNAMAWANFQNSAEARARSFTFTHTDGLSAQTNLDYSIPTFKIPNTVQAGGSSSLKVSVNGNARFSCPPTQTGNVLSANFNALTASFSLVYDDTPPRPSITYQVVPRSFSLAGVSDINTIEPQLNNAALLTSAMVGAMNYKSPALDRALRERGNGVLVLPPDLQALFPDAQLTIISLGTSGLPGAISDESGYIEMVHRCACSSSPTPITGQGVDGTVTVCPRPMLANRYCEEFSMRRRLAEQVPATITEHVQRRELATQEEDLASVLLLLGGKCITKAPTGAPTPARPTQQPSLLPTRLPTIPTVYREENASPCGETSTCAYIRDVYFFICPQGQAEVRECRRENSDIYCCNVDGARDGGGPVQGSFANGKPTLFAFLSLLPLLALAILA